ETAQRQTWWTVSKDDRVSSRLYQRNDALGLVASEDRRRPASDQGRPPGKPGVGHDQQSGGLGEHLEHGAVRVVGQPGNWNEGLPTIGRQPGQRVVTHEHGRPWITRSESREDHGGLVRNDLGTGDYVGSGQSGRILLDHVVSSTIPTLRQDRPGRVGLDAV